MARADRPGRRRAVVLMRQLTPDDVQAIAVLERLCFSSSWSAESYAIQFEIPGTGGWGIWDGELVAVLVHTPADCEATYIVTVATHPDHRKKGHASRLLEQASSLLKPHALHVRPSNKEAVSMYQRRGFFEVRRDENYYDDGEDAILMIRY